MIPKEIPLENIFTIKYEGPNPNNPRNINFYYDFHNGKTIVRAVVYLSNSGCEWSIKTGGCTMCGTKNNRMNRQITNQEYISQISEIKKQVKKYNHGHSVQVSTLHLYNDGLFFNDTEIDKNSREAMYELAKQLNVEKLVVETSGKNIIQDNKSNNYLKQAVKKLGDTELEVTLGCESTNPLVRSLYNKPDSVENVRCGLEIIRENNAIPKSYVLVKGPLMTEEEAYFDCVNTVKDLLVWSNGKRIRIELQPTCVLPNTLHEFLMSLDVSDPYHWEPPLLSTVLRIMDSFPKDRDDLYCALFARFDKESSWQFWKSRPHDDEETTHRLYLKLADYYINRRRAAINEALEISNQSLWNERTSKMVPHSLEERVSVVKKIIKLSMKKKMHLSDYLKANLNHEENFIEDCIKQL